MENCSSYQCQLNTLGVVGRAVGWASRWFTAILMTFQSFGCIGCLTCFIHPFLWGWTKPWTVWPAEVDVKIKSSLTFVYFYCPFLNQAVLWILDVILLYYWCTIVQSVDVVNFPWIEVFCPPQSGSASFRPSAVILNPGIHFVPFCLVGSDSRRNDIFHPTQAWEKAPQAAEREGFFPNRFGRMKGNEIWEKLFRQCKKVTKKVRSHWRLLPLWSISFRSSWVKLSDVFIWPKTLGNADEIMSWWTMTSSWNPYD